MSDGLHQDIVREALRLANANDARALDDLVEGHRGYIATLRSRAERARVLADAVRALPDDLDVWLHDIGCVVVPDRYTKTRECLFSLAPQVRALRAALVAYEKEENDAAS